MRWKSGRRSSNIEDRRGGVRSNRRMPFPLRRGSPIRMGRRASGLGIWGIVIIIVISLLLGKNPLELLGMMPDTQSDYSLTQSRPSAESNESAEFVSVVLADTEDTWTNLFQQNGGYYRQPKLVLYNDYTQTACGLGQAATGPFYCPGDSKVYLDLGFLNELQNLGAPGDFAVAYVIAHEIGHHVQNLLGTSREIQNLQSQVSQVEANALSVKLELQADCYAGIWAHHAQAERNILEAGDIEEGLQAASAVGDDRLQRRAGRSVQPESFTHGSSKQRMKWFSVGYQTGDVERCNTFIQ